MIDSQPDRNLQLLIRAKAGDKDSQELLVQENTGLVHSIVKRFSGRGQETEDLFQIGCIGLIKAVQRFDLSFGVRFSTYAVPMIMGEIKRFLRDDGIIKVSRSMRETASKAMALREAALNQTGREPTLGELAAELGLSPAELSSALESAIPPESIDASREDGTREQDPLLARLQSPDTADTTVVNRLALKQLMAELPGREKTIIYLRYYQEKTQTEIAGRLGISQVQVSRIEKKILSTMREKLSRD